MNEQTYLTAEGAERIRIELEQLKGPGRIEIAQRLRSAVQMGDLSENADYIKTKEDQGFLEGRIQELKYTLEIAIIVEESDQKPEVIRVGVKVTIQEANYPPETYQLVGAKEADPRKGRISNESPIGRAIIDHQVGDTVIAKTPGGEVSFKIIKIE